jgi:acyl carrier protein
MDKLNQILADNFKISLVDTTKNLGMDEVNEWDSLSHMNLIVTIEEEFKIEFTGDEIAEMITFDQIRKAVKKHVQP